jgi:hypothetical protein
LEYLKINKGNSKASIEKPELEKRKEMDDKTK